MRSNALLAVLMLVAVGCSQPSPAVTSAPPGSGATPGATSAPDPTTGLAEPGVITGRVTDAQGDPVVGAQMRIVGYTGGASLGRDIETVETGTDGVYRYDAGIGLYEVLGQAAIDFDGQTYTFDLHPVAGTCEQRMSDTGIVEDFELRLTGLRACTNDSPPDDYTSYHGAAIQLFDRTTDAPRDALVELSLAPATPLADGSPGSTLTFTRTMQAFTTSAGPIDDTWILHDIPLARYAATATLVMPDGSRAPLAVSSGFGEVSTEVEIRFDARTVLGGYTVPDLTIHDLPELG